MTIEHLQLVFAHMEWADARMLTAVRQSAATAEDDYILATQFHILETQQAFLNAWTERPFRRSSRDDFPDVEALITWSRGFHVEAKRFLDGLDQGRLGEELVLPWAKYFGRVLGHDPQPTTLADTLHQLPSHTMHHRGQLARRCKELGGAPPMTDYIAWAWEGRPDASWES